MDFEWDDQKAITNYSKHRVRFTEAASVWLDENALEIPDPEHSDSEDRWIRLGISSHLRILVVVYLEKLPNRLIRIISARKANKQEETEYLAKVIT